MRGDASRASACYTETRRVTSRGISTYALTLPGQDHSPPEIRRTKGRTPSPPLLARKRPAVKHLETDLNPHLGRE